MNALNSFADIVRNMGVIPGFDPVKIVTTAAKCKVTAITKTTPRVVCNGEIYMKIDGLNSSVGFHLHKLRDVLKAPGFDKSTAKLNVLYRTSEWPYIEIQTEKSQHEFKLWGSKFVESLIKVPHFKRPDFDLKITPAAEGIELLKYWTKQEATDTKADVYFWPCIDQRGRLHFQIDQGPMEVNMMRFVFARGLPFMKLAPYTYPAQPVINILSLASTSRSLTMSFSNAGCISIEVDSGIGHYEFVIPGGEGLISREGLADIWPQTLGVEKSMRDDAAMHCDFDPLASD